MKEVTNALGYVSVTKYYDGKIITRRFKNLEFAKQTAERHDSFTDVVSSCVYKLALGKEVTE